jgi:putative ABC transport system permease protein
MIKNYLLTFIRSLQKRKFITYLNIIGLTIAITAFIGILQFVTHELTYDNFHQERANIYRVESKFSQNGIVTDDWATSSGGYGPAMQREYPDIRSFCRIYLEGSERIVAFADVKHREQNVYFADPSLLDIFSFPLKKGDRNTALSEPNTAIISESASKRYFGDADPIGKTLKISNTRSTYECSITAVFEDVPANSHISFDILMSWTTMSGRWKGVDEFWYQHSAYTYVLLEPETDLAKIEQAFPALGEKHKTLETMKSHVWGVSLVPLEQIHLNKAKGNEREVKGSRSAVVILSVAAILTLLIAFVNYVNLATARALERAKEVSIRKTAGANKRMILQQFLLESALVSTISFLGALLLSFVMQPFLYSITGMNAGSFEPSELAAVFGIVMAMSLISGIYPAIILASFNPISALKGKVTRYGRGKIIRKCLVVFQFAISIILISVSLTVSRQVKFMQSKDTGVDTEQVLVVKIPAHTDNYDQKLEALRNELQKLSMVTGVTISSSVAGYEVGMNLANRRSGTNENETNLFEMLRTDPEYISTFRLQLLYGRNFSRDVQSDAEAVIINEEAVRLLGFKNAETALNQEVYLETSDKKFQVIGIAKNYHQTSLRDSHKPIMIFISPDFSWIPYSYVSLKLSLADWDETISSVRQQWQTIFPESSFDYFLLDEHVHRQYKTDIAFGKLIDMFCVLLVVIACLGLLGLAYFDAVLRRQEVGVRKVLGASVFQVLMLLSKEVLIMLAIAAAVALPFGYWIGHAWLSNYSFHLDLELMLLILPLLILLPIAFITVCSQAWRAAVTNPVDSLRNE